MAKHLDDCAATSWSYETADIERLPDFFVSWFECSSCGATTDPMLAEKYHAMDCSCPQHAEGLAEWADYNPDDDDDDPFDGYNA